MFPIKAEAEVFKFIKRNNSITPPDQDSLRLHYDVSVDILKTLQRFTGASKQNIFAAAKNTNVWKRWSQRLTFIRIFFAETLRMSENTFECTQQITNAVTARDSKKFFGRLFNSPFEIKTLFFDGQFIDEVTWKRFNWKSKNESMFWVSFKQIEIFETKESWNLTSRNGIYVQTTRNL